MKHLSFFVFVILLVACNSLFNKGKSAEKSSPIYWEKYRPQFHFSPPAGWMNDPNGMVYYAGDYHLFYQHYPDSTVWGPMHWGHAVSKDMVHWENLPIALYPDSLGLIFSGSAVVDWNNTAGLQSGNEKTLISIFTYSPASGIQSQGIAYSNDKGRTWMKYKNNPVLQNQGIADFRDPKVFWYGKGQKWMMTLAVKDHVELYSSPDLKSWVKESEFGSDAGAHGGVWECPDLFPLKVDSGDQTKWVMIVNINPGGPNGGSGTQYFVGDFDGHQFTAATKETSWLDFGRDNYAGVTWSDIPKEDGRRLFLGWMSNWDYANMVPTIAWRSAMTIPRELSLRNKNSRYFLNSNPVKELDIMVDPTTSVYHSAQNISGEKEIALDSITLNQSKLVFDFELDNSQADSMGIILENSLKEKFVIGYSLTKKQFVMDRSMAGSSAFSKEFAGNSKAPYMAGNKLHLELFIDASSVELFVDHGQLVMTNLVFPTEKFTKIKVYAYGGNLLLEKAVMSSLKRIW